MGWETALDRLLMQQVHLAEKDTTKTEQVHKQLLDYGEIGGGSPTPSLLERVRHPTIRQQRKPTLSNRSGASPAVRRTVLGTSKALVPLRAEPGFEELLRDTPPSRR